MYRFCLCGITAGNVIDILLINDLLFHPPATSSAINQIVNFMTQSTDSNLCISVTHTGTNGSPPLPQFKIGAFVHMQYNGFVGRRIGNGRGTTAIMPIFK